MGTMTARERLLAAIRFQGPDQVPVSPRLWRYMLAHGGTQRWQAYLKYAAEFDFDPLISYWAGPVFYVPRPGGDYSKLGTDIRVDEKEAIEGDCRVVSRVFHTPAGRLTDRTRVPRPGGQFGIAPNNHIEEYLVKGPEDLPALRLIVQARAAAQPAGDLRGLIAEAGDRALVAATVQSAVSHNAGDVYPLTEMMIDCFERRDFVKSLIGVFHRPVMTALQRVLEEGAELAFYSAFFESMSSGWSPSLYRELFLPLIKEGADLAHRYGVPYCVYDDGRQAATLPMWREIGVDLACTLTPPPVGDIDLAQARQVAGLRMGLHGGIDAVHTVWRGTPESIDAAVRDAILAAASPDGGYILGTSDSITEETPPVNFRAFFEAGRRHGTLRTSGP